MSEHAFTAEEAARLAAEPEDDYELETDEAIEAAKVICKHTPRVVVGDDLDCATVFCDCGLKYSTDNDEYVLIEWSVHLGVELDQAELLQR